MKSDRLEQLISSKIELKAMPQVVSRILELADDENSKIIEFEQTINQDAALAAKMMQIANSAYFGLNRQVTSTSQAVGILGIKAVRSMVISVSLSQIASQKSNVSNFSRANYWRHSLATAIAAKELAKKVLPNQAEDLFTAGLLHDIGYLVMEQVFPYEFAEAIEYSQEENVSLAVAERRFLGFDHTNAGAAVARQWNFSPALTNAIKNHHLPIADENEFAFLSIVHVANVLSNLAGICVLPSNSDGSIFPVVMEFLGFPFNEYESIKEIMLNELKTLEALYQIKPEAPKPLDDPDDHFELRLVS